ncbi:MAG: LacI family DNA-binding transcriptional regulator [bacterium]|nr:LacI family DNA-binding transcriptional regulator [bacterium]
MKITRKFIAKKANVSPTTVSDVLNRNPNARIGQKTKELVIQLAKKYNYYPNTVARSLVMKKTFNIGFIYTVPITFFLNDPFNNSIFAGIESEIEKNGYSFLFSLLKSDTDINYSVRKMVLGHIVDGLIFYRRIEKNLKNMLSENKTKFVLIDNYYPDMKTNSILPDNEAGAYQAVQYLIRKRALKIYCINGNEDHPSYKERPAGYKKAMEENGLEPIIFSVPPDIENTRVFITGLIRKGDIPEAFFTTGDHMAIGTLRALKENRIKVPEQVKLIGFDNIYLTEIESPRITTVNIPKIEMGTRAVKLLLQNINEEKEPEIVRLPTDLVIRETA